MAENISAGYREAMKKFVSIILENRSSYAQFARAADKEGLTEAARTLSTLEKEEVSQLSRFGSYGDTLHNLRHMVDRQLSKCKAVADLMNMASDTGDVETANEFRTILMDERMKLDRLKKLAEMIEKHGDRIKELRKQEEERKRKEEERKRKEEEETEREKYIPHEMTDFDIRDWY